MSVGGTTPCDAGELSPLLSKTKVDRSELGTESKEQQAIKNERVALSVTPLWTALMAASMLVLVSTITRHSKDSFNGNSANNLHQRNVDRHVDIPILSLSNDVVEKSPEASYTQAAQEDMITSLPGIDNIENVGFNMFSGYLTVSEKNGRHIFYWYVESQNDPASDPVVFWTNGGPGVSETVSFPKQNDIGWVNLLMA